MFPWESASGGLFINSWRQATKILVQGSKWIYALAMILFGFCNVITLWCAGYTVYLAVPHSVSGWENIGKYVQTYPAQ